MDGAGAMGPGPRPRRDRLPQASQRAEAPDLHRFWGLCVHRLPDFIINFIVQNEEAAKETDTPSQGCAVDCFVGASTQLFPRNGLCNSEPTDAPNRLTQTTDFSSGRTNLQDRLLSQDRLENTSQPFAGLASWPAQTASQARSRPPRRPQRVPGPGIASGVSLSVRALERDGTMKRSKLDDV